MGANDWILAFCDTEPRAVLRDRPVLDHAAARTAAERLHPGRALTAVADSTLAERSTPPSLHLYVGAFEGLTLVCTDLAVNPAVPSELAPEVLGAIPARQVYLHTMQSSINWFAAAVWEDGTLRRSVSVNSDDGFLEDIGEPWPCELPYREGRHRVDDPDDDPGAFLFDPLELSEVVLREVFGFTFEGVRGPDTLAPSRIPLAGFRIEPVGGRARGWRRLLSRS